MQDQAHIVAATSAHVREATQGMHGSVRAPLQGYATGTVSARSRRDTLLLRVYIVAEASGDPSARVLLHQAHGERAGERPASVITFVPGRRHPSSSTTTLARLPAERRHLSPSTTTSTQWSVERGHLSSSTTTSALELAERRHPSSLMATSLMLAAGGARRCLEVHLLQHEVQVRRGTLHVRACACTTTS